MIIETEQQLEGFLAELRSDGLDWKTAIFAVDTHDHNQRVLLLDVDGAIVKSFVWNTDMKEFSALSALVASQWKFLKTPKSQNLPNRGDEVSAEKLPKLLDKHLKEFLSQPSRPKKKSGRTGDISLPTARKVFLDSHLRCMFEGCGEALDRSYLAGEKAYFGYLAHIVPASENGPRGDQAKEGECKRLADCRENIILLCDKCHRLIDRVAVAEYPRQRLEKMRRDFIQKSDRCLDALQYPESDCVSFLWPIGGHHVKGPTAKQIAESLRLLELCPSGMNHPISETNFGVPDNKTREYWMTAPMQLIAAEQRFRSLNLKNTSSPAALAVLAPMPAQIALGALIGSKANVRPLLCSRKDDWSWREGDSLLWTTEFPEAQWSSPEVVLSINLTQYPEGIHLKEQELQNKKGCPLISIQAKEFSNQCVGNLAEAKMLQNEIWTLLNQLRSEHGVKKVHLLICASNLACLAVGMGIEQYAPEVQIYDFLNSTQEIISLQPILNLLPSNQGINVELAF